MSFPKRPTTRQIGIKIGVLPYGPLDAITDVKGVLVGQVTIKRGNNIRTGVTAVIPHPGNVFKDRVPASIYIGNGFGKITGVTQVYELGQLETPIVLTNTLSVPTAADALIDYTLSFKENSNVRSINPVVGETNDGWLNDIQGRHVRKRDVLNALHEASSGPVKQGSVGAGTGTVCFGFKGGIGTASRLLPDRFGGYTVGVLVQTNFGGVLQVAGCPVGIELGQYYLKDLLDRNADGSCMIIVATDAPLLDRNLRRLAKRAMLGLGKTGGISSNGSGDYVIAFSTANSVRMPYKSNRRLWHFKEVPNDRMSPLFMAVIEATEEAILNSLFTAETVKGRDGHIAYALPIDKVKKILKQHKNIK